MLSRRIRLDLYLCIFADWIRIYYDKESGSWKFEGDDGTEMEYDGVKGKWVSIVRPLKPLQRDKTS